MTCRELGGFFKIISEEIKRERRHLFVILVKALLMRGAIPVFAACEEIEICRNIRLLIEFNLQFISRHVSIDTWRGTYCAIEIFIRMKHPEQRPGVCLSHTLRNRGSSNTLFPLFPSFSLSLSLSLARSIC